MTKEERSTALRDIVLGLGLLTPDQLDEAGAAAQASGKSVWQELRQRDVISQAHYDSLELAGKGYMAIEAAKAAISSDLQKQQSLAKSTPQVRKTASPAITVTKAAESEHGVPSPTGRALLNKTSVNRVDIGRPKAPPPRPLRTPGGAPAPSEAPEPPPRASTERVSLPPKASPQVAFGGASTQAATSHHGMPKTELDPAGVQSAAEEGEQSPGASPPRAPTPAPQQPAPQRPPQSRGTLQGLVGRRFGKYQITSQLGRGASGSVYMAHHVMLNMPVALKVLDPTLAAYHPELLNRFMHEARSAARINHTNIVRVLDCDEIEGLYLIVMEYVDGISLSELININGTVAEERALVMIQSVAEGLEAALEAGIIHRDIKPANILVTKSKQVKLADLGLAKNLGEGDLSDTRPNVGLGTPHYFAPEQAVDAAAADHRADIYALGATLYHMITGMIPFRGKTLTELIRQHQEEPLVPPSEIVNGITRQTSALVGRMMAKNPTDRPQTYSDLINGIQTCILNAQANKTHHDTSTSKTVNRVRGLFGGLFERK